MSPIRFVFLLSAVPMLGQAQTSSYPALIADWQRNRTTVLAYIDAMPDSAMGFRPTPGVRTFAQQFDHIVTTNLEVAAVALRGPKAPPGRQRGLPPQESGALSFEHAVWTLGQLVPYLRLNGVKPPDYSMPF